MAADHNFRVSESDLTNPALRILAEQPDGFIHTSKLIEELEGFFAPVGKDAEIIDGRSDTYFSQKVRNLISHRNSGSNFIAKGYAEYDRSRRGLRITDLGRKTMEH